MQAIKLQDYSVRFDFYEDGEFFVPDVGSVTYTIYDNSGDVLGLLTDQAVSTDSSTQHVIIDIDGVNHSISAGKSFEQRTVRLKYEKSGQKKSIIRHYYVTEFLNYRVSPEDVLEAIGIKQGEMFLHEVDLVRAYTFLKAKLGATVLDTALAAGTVDQLRANEAIKYQAALSLTAALEFKVLRKAGGDMLSFTRFEGLDFHKIRASIQSKLAESLEELQGDDATTFLTLSTPTDAVTGA